MKALMSLQEEQEEYIVKTQREKQELKQEMEAKSRALEEAQRQLEEVRANRHRVDLDVVVRGTPSVSNTSFILLCELGHGGKQVQLCLHFLKPQAVFCVSLSHFSVQMLQLVFSDSSAILSSTLCLRQAAQRKLRQASTNVKHWNVQMNRLMRPIGPGGKSFNEKSHYMKV